MRDRIREILKSKGLTAKDLAKEMGISEAALSLSLKGNPTLSRLQEIAMALNVEVADLFASSKSQVNCPHCGKPLNIKIE